jgi:hypothetical protein
MKGSFVCCRQGAGELEPDGTKAPRPRERPATFFIFPDRRGSPRGAVDRSTRARPRSLECALAMTLTTLAPRACLTDCSGFGHQGGSHEPYTSDD